MKINVRPHNVKCEISMGKGIVAVQTIPAMDMMINARDAANRLPLSVKIIDLPCSFSQQQQKEHDTILIKGLNKDTMDEYVFASGPDRFIYPIIQLVNHGEGRREMNACVFYNPETKTAYLSDHYHQG